MVVQSTSLNTVSLSFPASFTLPDLLALYEPVFELKKSPFQEPVGKAGREWFAGCVSLYFHIFFRYLCVNILLKRPCFVIYRFGHFDDDKLDNYLKTGWFDLYVALAFPNADAKHLETCLYFLLWAFSVSCLFFKGG